MSYNVQEELLEICRCVYLFWNHVFFPFVFAMGDSWFVGFSPTPVVRYTYVIRSGVQMRVQWDSVSSHSPGDRSSVFTRSKIRRDEQMFERLGKKISASAPIASYYSGILFQATLMTFFRPHSRSILGHTHAPIPSRTDAHKDAYFRPH